jgi:DNA-binding response OmpR family regulator
VGGSTFECGAPVSILLLQHNAAEAVALASIVQEAGFAVSVELDAENLGPADVDAFDVIVIGVVERVEARVRLCSRLRAEGYLGAIVALSTQASEISTLIDAGADDFAVAPVQTSELVARVQMAIHRVVARARCRWGLVEIDRFHRTAYLRGRPLTLTSRECELLSCLIEAAGRVVSRADLLSRVWRREDDPGSNLVEVHLSRLRDKLGADAAMIETVRRAGYRLRRTEDHGRQP